MRSKGLMFGAIASALALTHAAAAPGPAIPTAVPLTLPTAKVALALPTRQVVITHPQLSAIVRTKRAYDAKAMAAGIVVKPSSVLMTLKNGATITIPTLTPSTAVQLATPLDTTLLPLATHIKSDWVSSKPTLSTNDVTHVGRQTPIRNQGGRGTCTAFASVALLESFYCWKQNVGLDLSENHAYHLGAMAAGSTCPQDPGLLITPMADSLQGAVICSEKLMPYGPAPNDDAPHIPTACASGFKQGFQTTKKVPAPANTSDPYFHSNNTNYLEAILFAGHDLVYGVGVAGTDWKDGTAETGVIDVQQQNGLPAPSIGGHAMLLVGYHRDPTNSANSYFIFKNSWGSDQGHGGYFHLSYHYLQTYGGGAFYVTAATSPGVASSACGPGGVPATPGTSPSSTSTSTSGCAQDGDCTAEDGNTGRCDLGSKKCIPQDGKGNSGAYCTSNAQCAIKSCVNNTCAFPKPKMFGGPCQAGSPCAAGDGQCVAIDGANKCAPTSGKGYPGDFCTDNVQCKNGVCAAHVCN